MELMVLDKEDSWEEHKKKIKEESAELLEAIDENDKAHIAEEALDNIQVAIGVLEKLNHSGVDIQQAIHKHNKKLINRGWKAKAIVKVHINKR